MKLEFSREIFEKYLNIKFHEIPVGAESFRANTRTAGSDEAVAFRSFVKVPKNEEDLKYITSVALVSHHSSSCAHDVFITGCCKEKYDMKLKVSYNDIFTRFSYDRRNSPYVEDCGRNMVTL